MRRFSPVSPGLCLHVQNVFSSAGLHQCGGLALFCCAGTRDGGEKMSENRTRFRLDQRRAPIYEALEQFRQMRVVPFDVPGHKRGRGNPELTKLLGETCMRLDVNSMKPLDNLCHPVSVIADAEQIKRVINNIVSNSIKYMDKSHKVINIRLRDVGDFVQVEIEDNGKGIATKDLTMIFDRFYRTDASRNSTRGGSGIGLSIVKKILEDAGVGYLKLGKPTDERHILVSKGDATYQFGIDYMRDVWYSTSYLLDRKQSMNGCAKKRFENYKMQPVEFAFMPDFKGKFSQYGIDPDRRTPSGIRAAIIREKGTNGEREMAYSLYLAGFDVKDVTMTDLISGRETLEDVNMIVYCGGFSNSDVLGSAKGWAGAFLFNPKAKEALDKYYAREDTLSLGVCNGCQLMMELNLINPEHKKNGKMLHNDSHKFESRFLGVTVPTNRSVMLGSLSGSKLGIWVAHGEGKFSLPYDEDKYNVVAKYSYDEYPANPNGSDYSVAALASADGRHLAIMPHLERSIFPWQNGCYPTDRKNSDQVTPWIEAFVNAHKWIETKIK